MREFLIRYQDRILYGTDIAHGPDTTDESVAAEAAEAWRNDWKFLNTADAMTSEDFDGTFQGLELPRAVADRIYRGNALATFRGAWDTPSAQK